MQEEQVSAEELIDSGSESEEAPEQVVIIQKATKTAPKSAPKEKKPKQKKAPKVTTVYVEVEEEQAIESEPASDSEQSEEVV